MEFTHCFLEDQVSEVLSIPMPVLFGVSLPVNFNNRPEIRFMPIKVSSTVNFLIIVFFLTEMFAVNIPCVVFNIAVRTGRVLKYRVRVANNVLTKYF